MRESIHECLYSYNDVQPHIQAYLHVQENAGFLDCPIDVELECV